MASPSIDLTATADSSILQTFVDQNVPEQEK